MKKLLQLDNKRVLQLQIQMNVRQELSNGDCLNLRDFFILLNLFRWLPEKGYGFLQLNNGRPDVFVHLRDLTDGTMSLEEGQIVEFDIKNSEKGEMAQNVIVRNEPE